MVNGAADRDGWVAVARQLADALAALPISFAGQFADLGAQTEAALAAFRALNQQETP